MARVDLRIFSSGELPPVCVCCGEPAARFRTQDFRADGPLSVAVLSASVLAGGLAWTERGVTLRLPICEYHRKRGRRSNRTFFRGTALAATLGAAAYAASLFGGPAASYLAVAAAVAFMVTLVAAMHEADDGLKVQFRSKNAPALTGVSRRFAEAAELAPGLGGRSSIG